MQFIETKHVVPSRRQTTKEGAALFAVTLSGVSLD